MSKPRQYWYSFVQKYLYKYKKLDDSKPKEYEAKRAIDETMEENDRTEEGRIVNAIVKMVYIDNRYTIQGAADKEYVSRRTAERWVSSFIYKVGDRMGYR